MPNALRRSPVALLVLLCATAFAQGPSSERPKVSANNADAIQRHIGREVTLRGKVSRTSKSKTGHHFLNFYGSSLSVICFKEDAGKFPGGGPAALFREKDIEVSGKLELYKGKPQIKLRRPTQIRLARSDTSSEKNEKQDADKSNRRSDTSARSDAANTKPSDLPLKRIGDTTWLSPAGLRYAGRDPQGLTRVEHVLRHAQDQPTRAGSHGVFDGGPRQALATIDDAWKRAQQQEIKPDKQGDRSAYLVPMGRRVGFLGGKAGASRGHPSLDRVFIVVRAGTSEVITAFPR